MDRKYGCSLLRIGKLIEVGQIVNIFRVLIGVGLALK